MSDADNNKTLIIVLATAVPVLILIIVGAALFHRSYKRRYLFLKRGITPIDDEEIESWKRSNNNPEKTPIVEPMMTQQRRQNTNESIGSIRKPPSVIVYSNPAAYHPRMSEEMSPRSLHHKRSMDVPQTPVLARAPNSRPGLTDETVQGEDAFIPPLRRQPSRLSKMPPGSPRQQHHRTRSSRSSISAMGHYWHGHNSLDYQVTPRQSNDYYPRTPHSFDIRRHQRMHSASNPPPRLSVDDEIFLGGLSPRPTVHQSDIGRAIG